MFGRYIQQLPLSSILDETPVATHQSNLERWAARFAHKCSNMIYQRWTHQNVALHEAANQNSGATLLIVARTREHTVDV